MIINNDSFNNNFRRVKVITWVFALNPGFCNNQCCTCKPNFFHILAYKETVFEYLYAFSQKNHLQMRLGYRFSEN